MTTGTRKDGEFCWINVLTPQADEAREFFSKLLGWTYSEMPGMGHVIKVGSRDAGAIFDLANPMTPPGTPAVIGVMVKVRNADEMVERVNALGGSAKPAWDIMENGRMASCTDPNGAVIDLWQPKKEPGASADQTHHGAPSWFETMTTDTAKAKEFYTALFGWTAEAMPMGNDMEYTTFKLGESYAAGMIALSPEMGNVPPHWATYMTVDDTDEAVRRAVELGASVSVPPQDVPQVGRFAGITSPQGVAFFVIKYAPMQ